MNDINKNSSNIFVVKRSIIQPTGYNHQDQYQIVNLVDFIKPFALSISAIATLQVTKIIAKIKSIFCNNILKSKKLNHLSIVVSCFFAINFNVDAKDFGTKGHIYRIIEQPFLRMIDERLQKVDMRKEQEKMTAIVKDRALNPKAVEGLLPATKSRVFYFDPTYTLEEDAVLPCGKILHKAGTKVNPLEHMDLNRRLFFIDSREFTQIKWLKGQLAASDIDSNKLLDQKELIEDRIILVGGSVSKLKEELGAEHKNKVYFDQHGELTTKFGIKASPAIARQDGLRLKIEEIKLLYKEEGKASKLNKSSDKQNEEESNDRRK